MNSKMNSVIQLIEQSLGDAFYFLVYYGILLGLFCILFMVLGSVISVADYSGLDKGNNGDESIRYIYYMIQIFRNSIGDLQAPMY